MTARSWIRKLFARTPRTVRKAPARCRPAVEALEDRFLPAVTFVPAVIYGAGSNPDSVAVGDFNGDGKPDLAVADALSNDVSVLLNTTSTPPTVAVPTAQTAYEDEDTASSGISVGDAESASLTVTLSVGHGRLKLRTTTGLTVSGNGTGW